MAGGFGPGPRDGFTVNVAKSSRLPEGQVAALETDDVT
jgi:hypothetical protein